MQSLALDVNVVSEEGEQGEMRDEDDDLLRAAEELGIDLSGCALPAAPAAEALDADPEGSADVAPTGAGAVLDTMRRRGRRREPHGARGGAGRVTESST